MKKIKFLFLTIVSLILINCSTKESPEIKLRNNIGDVFMDKIIEQTKGEIISKESDKDLYIIVSTVPDFYNEIFMMFTVELIRMSYTDIKAIKEWENKDDKIRKSYLIGGEYLLSVTYSHKDKLFACGIVFLKNENNLNINT